MKLSIKVLILLCGIFVIGITGEDQGGYIQEKQQEIPVPIVTEWTGVEIMTGYGTWYRYELFGDPRWADTHRTCALRIGRENRYKMYRVCNLDNGKCVECFHNDYGPKEYTNKLIDLSSLAFSELAPLSRGVVKVSVQLIQ